MQFDYHATIKKLLRCAPHTLLIIHFLDWKFKILFHFGTNCFSKGIDFNAKGSNGGMTAFIYTCYYGHKYVVKLLLQDSGSTSIDLNNRDSNGMTPLMLHMSYVFKHLMLRQNITTVRFARVRWEKNDLQCYESWTEATILWQSSCERGWGSQSRIMINVLNLGQTTRWWSLLKPQ